MLAMLILGGGWSVAQAQTVADLSLSADQTEFLLGEPIAIHLNVTHSAGSTVFVPELDRWGDVRVREQSRLQSTANDDGTETTIQTILISRFVLGEFATQPLTVTIRNGDGKVNELFAPPITLTVRATITDVASAALADIRPQAALPEPFITPQQAIQWGAVLAGLFAVTALISWLFLRQQAPQPIPVIVDPRLPHEVAFDELDRIERLELPKQGAFKEHYIALSDCLRDYIHRRYTISALDMTTAEIKSHLKQTPLPLEQQKAMLNLLMEFDMGKYAEFTPTVIEAVHLVEASRHVVEMTMEQDAPPSQ